MVDLIKLALWAITSLLQVLILVVMIWHRLHREFPIFLVYTLFHASKSGILFLVHHYGTYTQYFYCYWLATPLSLLLGLLVIQELYSRAFRPYEGMRRLGTVLFRWAAIVLMIVAVVSASAAPAIDAQRVMAAILVGERSMRIVQGGLLVFLFLLVSCFGLRLNRFAMGIGLGFALFTSIELAALAVRAYVGEGAASLFSVVHALAYLCALVVWAWYALVPERQQRSVPAVPENDLDVWNAKLLELLQQ